MSLLCFALLLLCVVWQCCAVLCCSHVVALFSVPVVTDSPLPLLLAAAEFEMRWEISVDPFYL
jgi:hypothetical protein